MNTSIINMLFLFFSCTPAKQDIRDGLYYGRGHGFFPQNIVYATINKDTAYVECYLPLKGAFFHTLSDTLMLTDKETTLFTGEKSEIYLKRRRLFFRSIPNGSEYKIEETQITYQPQKENEHLQIRSQAKPFKDSK